jgi:hypothetical protein
MKPGDFIRYENSYKVKPLVSPGVYYKVTQGMTMKIVPTEHMEWPPPYRDATEKYSQQVRLSPDGRTMVNYVAGQPFPFLDPNDPKIATKIMWNNAFRPITSDDYDLRFYDCGDMYTGRNRSVRMLDYFQIGHYAGYDEVGRTEVEPIQSTPTSKQLTATGCSPSTRSWLPKTCVAAVLSVTAMKIRRRPTTFGSGPRERAESGV